MKGKKIIILVVMLAMIIAVSGTFFLSRSQEVMSRAQSMVGEELSKALGSVVTVGQVEVTSFHTMIIHDITIYDKQAQALLASEKITLTYHPLSILRGQAVVAAISDMTVEKPTLWLTQTSGGRWNVQDLLQDDSASNTSFTSKITLVDGKAVLKTVGGNWIIENINGGLDFAQNPSLGLDVQAVYKGENVKAKGSISSQGRSAVTLAAGELLLADYQTFLPEGPLELVGGSIKNVTVTVIRDKGNLEWTGSTDLVAVDLNVDGIPLRHVDGNMIFTNKNMYVFAGATIFEQPITVRGSIGLDASQPILKLTVASTDFDVSVINSSLPISGRVAFKADVAGISTSPIITGDVKLATGNLFGYAVNQVHANLFIRDKKVKINQFSGNLLGGGVTGAGNVAMDASSYELSFDAKHIDLGNFSELLPDSSGYGDIKAKLQGMGSLETASVQGTVGMEQGKIAGVNFRSLGIGFYRHNGMTDLDYVNIGLGQGIVTASGQIDHDNINVTASGHAVSLEELAQQKAGLVSGSGDFIAQIKGTLQNPEGVIDFTAINGQVLDQPFGELKGNVSLNREQVVLNNVELLDGVTRHNVKGTIDLQGIRNVNIQAHSVRARAEKLVAVLLPGEKLTGNVDNDMVLTGPLDNMNIEGQVHLTDGSFRGQLIAKGQGFYKRAQGITTISQFSIDSLNTQIKLGGEISPNNDLNLDISAQDLDMERVNLKIPYPITGRTQFVGKLTGTPSAPIFNGQFTANSIKINSQEVKNISGQVVLHDNEIEIPSLNFMQGTGKFSAAGGVVTNTNEVYGSFDVENAELEPMLATFKLPNKGIHGQLNGHIRISGTMERPNVWLTGDLKAGHIKQYPVESIKLDVALENNILQINELSATQGAGVLMARGTADLDGPLNVEVGGREIDAGMVAALLDSKIEPKGKMEFAAQITGVASNPHTAISLEIVNGGVEDSTFDSLYGLLIVDKNIIHVDQVLLKKGPYQASAYGIIPMAALNLNGHEEEAAREQMDLKLRLDQADLSILPLLTKEVAWATGPTKGEINVTGTLTKPLISGQVTVENGVLKLTNIMSPIQKVGVDISFEGDTINVRKFDGHLGTGMYSLTGKTKLSGLTIGDYDFSLLLDKPDIKSKYFTGVVVGDLNFNNKNKKGKLSGKLLFENDIINIPGIPDMGASDLDIDLAVEMRVGKKVRFYNPFLYDIIAQGRLNFGGSTVKPDFTGRIMAVRGSVNYLRTQFKVNEASVSFNNFSSLTPMVKLSAQTALQQVTVNLDVNGPINEMQFSLTSDPTMKQQEILSLLTLRSRYADKQSNGNTGMGKDELVSALGAGLQLQFMSEVEGTFRSALGLDEFRVVQDTTSDILKKRYNTHEAVTLSQEVYNIEMSKYLTDKVMLTYTMGINYDNRDLDLRYALSRRTSLNASVDEQSRMWFGFETRFKF